MRRPIITIVLLGLLVIAGLYAKRKFYDPKNKLEIADKQITQLSDKNDLKDGDIIFQTSLSGQSQAIQQATHSKYSHCGIIFKNGSDYFVYEAVEPVKMTPLNKWIARGQGEHFVIKRLKNANQILTKAAVQKMKQVAERFKSKHYDIYFEWTDEKIYCSELIWKVYKESTGLDIGKLEKLKDFDLTSGQVRQKMKDRYGDKIPLDEIVISPASIYKSDLLLTVRSN